MAARKFSAEFWKKASEPPFLSPPPLFREASSVAAVSEAAALDGVHAIGVFHIGEVDNAEAAVLGQLALLAVLAVLVEEVPCQSREFVVIDHHGKAFG